MVVKQLHEAILDIQLDVEEKVAPNVEQLIGRARAPVIKGGAKTHVIGDQVLSQLKTQLDAYRGSLHLLCDRAKQLDVEVELPDDSEEL